MAEGAIHEFFTQRSLGDARRAAVARTLADLERSLAPRGLADASASDLSAFLDDQLAKGLHPNTVRKSRAMVRSFYGWLYERGEISADTLLAIRAIRPPAGSSRRPQPKPYRRGDLSELRLALDDRWPRMAADEACRYAAKWREGRSPYERIRRHAIGLQLDAVIALALEMGLRRSEIYALDIDAMHPDNAYVVVWGKDGPWGQTARTVPFTDDARQAVSDWIEFRSLLGAEHDRPWLALHAGPTATEPMKRDSFCRHLRTFVGAGWTLKRLRDTCAVGWINRGLSLEHARELLGLRSIEDTLPYARLITGTLERRLASFSAPEFPLEIQQPNAS